MFGHIGPRVPDRADQLASDAVARGSREEDGQVGPLIERRTALGLLLHRALVEALADLLWPGCDDLIKQACVERPRRDSVHINPIIARLFGQCLSKTHNRRLRCRVGADSWQRIGCTAAGYLDNLTVTLSLEVRQHGPAE